MRNSEIISFNAQRNLRTYVQTPSSGNILVLPMQKKQGNKQMKTGVHCAVMVLCLG